ncbi:MAG TPA: cytochrome c biogenesis protein ResB [Verrucomicrobiae bacterium]
MLLDRLITLFTSLKLTVVCLVLAMLLVFFGTIAQVEMGLYKAQNEFFRSFLVYWGPPGAGWKVPVFPGGYLVGGVLLINLFAAHLRYYRSGFKKLGIVLIHLGIVLLLLGQFATDLLSVESSMHLREGETKNYSEVDRRTELAIVEVSDPKQDKVVAIPQGVLQRQGEISHSELPFTVRVKQFMANSTVADRKPNSNEPAAAGQGFGPQITVKELPHVTEMNRRDIPSVLVEIATLKGSLGTWLATEFISQPQRFTVDNRTFQLMLRPRREYTPHSLKLLDFRHDKYPGTEIPKNFSSRVQLHNPKTGEQREVLIYMNNPLRYGGATYYQASFDTDNQGSILQVVRNPSWLTPYLACVMVSAGLVLQFLMHLVGFLGKRRTT